MNKFIVCTLLLSGLSVFAQDKDKVSTGHKSVISSDLKSVGDTCASNFESVMTQLAQVYNSERTSVTVKYEHAVSYEKKVELYDMRTIKNESGKTKQKINSRIEFLEDNTPANFSGSVSFYDIPSDIDADATVKKDLSAVLVELGLLSRELKLKCANSIADKKSQL